MMLAAQPITMTSQNLVDVCAGTAFFVVGVATSAIAVGLRRMGTRIFLWLGIWCAVYGANDLWPVFDAFAPSPVAVLKPYLQTTMNYLVLPFASLAWMEATKSWMRRWSTWLVALGFAIAVVGLVAFIITGDPYTMQEPNNFVAACGLALLLSVVASPRLFAKYSGMRSRGFFGVGAALFTIEALFSNLANALGYRLPSILGHVGFAILLIAFGHAALQMVLGRERRLLAMQDELDVAREIQVSILPREVPKTAGLRVTATYKPAASVAGDFYEFLAVNEQQVGIFVADVCGHGVAAALIASMLKVAVQSAAAYAAEPGELLATLNRTLAGALQGQLVSAAYLWLDMEKRVARYSAAGHPALLLWRDGDLRAVESNGLLFGVLPECVYPVAEIALAEQDRVLLYTDGVLEAENPKGEAFGEAGVAQVLGRSNGVDACAPMLAEIRRWQAGAAQQDDITMIVVDVAAVAQAETTTSGVSPGRAGSYSAVNGI